MRFDIPSCIRQIHEKLLTSIIYNDSEVLLRAGTRAVHGHLRKNLAGEMWVDVYGQNKQLKKLEKLVHENGLFDICYTTPGESRLVDKVLQVIRPVTNFTYEILPEWVDRRARCRA